MGSGSQDVKFYHHLQPQLASTSIGKLTPATPKCNLLNDILCVECVRSGCVTPSAIARLVNRDVGSISSSVRRLTDRILEEPELARRLMSMQAETEGEA
jgi:hypothetical protein